MGIQRSLVDFPHMGQWREALMFSLICTWTNGWENKQDAGDLRRHGAHDDESIMTSLFWMIYINMITESKGLAKTSNHDGI